MGLKENKTAEESRLSLKEILLKNPKQFVEVLKKKAVQFVRMYWELFLFVLVLLLLFIVILKYYGGRIMIFLIVSGVLIKILLAGRKS